MNYVNLISTRITHCSTDIMMSVFFRPEITFFLRKIHLQTVAISELFCFAQMMCTKSYVD